MYQRARFQIIERTVALNRRSDKDRLVNKVNTNEN